MGTSNFIDSSAASLFEVPEPDSPLVVQELQIGGASRVDPIWIIAAGRMCLPGNLQHRAPHV
jgi:hypothetical protein